MQFFATLHVSWGIWIWITQISYKTVFTKSQNQRNAEPSIFTFFYQLLILNCASIVPAYLQYLKARLKTKENLSLSARI